MKTIAAESRSASSKVRQSALLVDDVRDFECSPATASDRLSETLACDGFELSAASRLQVHDEPHDQGAPKVSQCD